MSTISGSPRWRGVPRAASRAASAGAGRLTVALGGPARTRVIVTLACVLALASADAATVGASAIELRQALHIDNTDIGLLVAVSSVVGAVASVPFGMLADRVRRTWTLSIAVALWGLAMLASASAHTFDGLLFWRLGLGFVTAAAGPAVASLIGDYFDAGERGRIYSYVLLGELVGAGAGFAITGDVAALSWRVAFGILAVAAFPLAWTLWRLPEPVRGGGGTLLPESGRVERPVENGAVPAREPEPPEPARPGAEPGSSLEPAWDPRWASEAEADDPHPTPPYPLELPAGAPVTAGSEQRDTDAQRLAREQGVEADPELVARVRGRRLGLISATRYVLAVRTNVALILSGACAYYFLAGVQTFGVEFVRRQYHTNTALANLLMLVIGGGAAIGVVAAGPVSDALLRRGHLRSRLYVAGLAASAAVLLFIPALVTHSVITALPYVTLAGAALAAQNPPIDAARLDIMPSFLWGRAEGIRSFLRTSAQALAPLVFGFTSDYIGLRWTFVVMLAPLAASAVFLFRGLKTYPGDVATAAAASTPIAPGSV